MALYHLALDGDEAQSLELLLRQAPTEAGIYNSHLRRYVSILQEVITVSAGVANTIPSIRWIRYLVDTVKELYQAKRNGRNRVPKIHKVESQF